MDRILVKPMRREDVPAAGKIFYQAFNRAFAEAGRSKPIVDQKAGVARVAELLRIDPEGCLVARYKNRTVGFGCIHLRGKVGSIGPVAIHPRYQDLDIGRELMEALMDIGRECESLRLSQNAFHVPSFALYLKLGFRAVECGLMMGAKGAALIRARPLGEVEPMTKSDLRNIIQLDEKFYGGPRGKDFAELLHTGAGWLTRDGKEINGFLFARNEGELCFIGPGMATTVKDMKRLFSTVSASQSAARGMMLACLFSSQQELVRHALSLGFRINHLALYMVRGKFRRFRIPSLLHYPPQVV